MKKSIEVMPIDYIEFGATDLVAIKAFYGEVFGWTFMDYGDTYTSFADGRLTGGFATDVPIGTSPMVVLRASDLEEALARVKQHGGEIVQAIFAVPGGRRFHVRDPAGNRLGVWSE